MEKDNNSQFYKIISGILTPEEKMYIISKLKNKSCDTCQNKSCNIENSLNTEKVNSTEANDCSNWYNDELIGKCKVLKISDVRKMK